MSSPETRTEVTCPVCKAKVIWDDSSPWRPFCSERCRMIDLGDWLAENHCISEPVDEYQVPEPDEQ